MDFLLRSDLGVDVACFQNVRPESVPLVGRAAEECTQTVRAIYLAVLARQPRDAEMQRMLAHVEKSPMPMQGYRDVYWVLVNSAEFVLNH